MFQSIEKIRRKPEVQKERIVLGITITLFLGIVFVWLSFVDIVNMTGDDNSLNQKAQTPISTMKETVTSIFDDARDDVDTLKEQFGDGGIE